MKTLLQIIAGIVLVLGALVVAIVAWALATEYRPDPVEPVPVECDIEGEALQAGTPFTVLSWNLQYSASRKHRFFYDGGDVVHVPQADVDATVRAISQVLREQAPDIALLQEVDRDSTRTGRIDQLPAFRIAAEAACSAAAPYHKSPFVPAPAGNPLGRVDMELAVLTRGPMTAAHRIQLPLLDEPFYRKVFNLKRAILTAEIPVKGWGSPLAVANTHLSAFSHGDGTLSRQVDKLIEWIQARPEGQPWILAGDMNMLPPGFDKSTLSTERDLYADADNPIERLLPLGTEVLGDQLAPGNRTYLPYGARQPDRKIDYMLVGGPIHVINARVLHQHDDISDHLPIVARLVIGRPPRPPPTAPASAIDALEADRADPPAATGL
ncbi:MAG: hypothetical protein D6798_17915 [Deltaproteobacteria bacterium]|nr:MAG: hypothetical protein D6798_17915 [Deltaproteobacteria bacterium]